MAKGTSIGDINFGVYVNTKGMDKAISQLARFQQQTRQIARTQTADAQKTAKAMGRQETELTKAVQRIANLNQNIKNLNLTQAEESRLIARNTQAFKAYVNQMTKSALSTEDFNRNAQAFAASLNNVAREVKQIKADEAAKGMNWFAETFRELESGAVLAVGPLSGIGARIRAIGAITSRTNIEIAAAIGVIAGLTIGIVKLTSEAIRVNHAFEQMEARFKVATGSFAGAAREIEYVTKISQELGLELDVTGRAYSRMAAAAQGTGITSKEVRSVFMGISRASAALRLDNQSVEGSFRALEQMMSKGTVAAEELRGQLGERLPKAFALAAEAMGVTTVELNKMLKNGEVLAADFLPKFGKVLNEMFTEDAKSNVDAWSGSINNLTTQWMLTAHAFDEAFGITDKFVQGMKAATGALKYLESAMSSAAAIADKFWSALVGVTAALAFFYSAQVITGFTLLYNQLRMLTIATVAWNFALAANPLGAVATGLMKLVGAIAVGVAAFAGFEWATRDAKDVLAEMDEEAKKVTKSYEELKEELKTWPKGPNFANKKLLDFEKTEELDEMRIKTQLRFDAVGGGEEAIKMLEDITIPTALYREELEKLQKSLRGTKDAISDTYVKLAVDNMEKVLTKEKESKDLIRDTIQAIRDKVAAERKARELIKSTSEDIAIMNERIKAMGEGGKGLAYFDAVTSKVMELRNELLDVGLEEQHIVNITKTYAKALDEVFKVQQQMKLAETFAKANDQLHLAKARLAALKKGAESLELFEAVEAQVIKFEQTFKPLIENQEQLNALVATYRILMEETYKANKNLEAEKLMAKTKDSIRDLMNELILLNMRVKAIGEGGEGAEHFDNVTAKVVQLRQQLQPIIKDQELLNNVTRVYRDALEDVFKVQQESKAAEAFADINQKLEITRMRLEAIRGGVESLDIFDNVTAKVIAFEQKFAPLIKDQELLNTLVAEYRTLMKESFQADKALDAEKLIGKAKEQLSDLQDEMKALEGGPETLEYYKKVGKHVDKLRDSFKGTAYNEQEVERIAREYEQTLARILKLQKDMVAQQAFKRGAEEIADLQDRLMAINQGPQALEYYENITLKVQEYRDQLIAAGVDQENINLLTEEFARVLEEVYEAEASMSDWANEMGQAITNAFEQGILEANNFKDVLQSLLKEIARIILRLLILDNLQRQISSALGGISIGAGAGASGAGASGGVGASGAQAAGSIQIATGGFVKGPGTKTSDSIPAMLSDGEFVVRADAVNKYGAELFSDLNKMTFDSEKIRESLRGVPVVHDQSALTAMPELPSFDIKIPDIKVAANKVSTSRNAGKTKERDEKLIGAFAHGGSFNVGGSGGTDSQIVKFRATPGEQVIIKTPADARAEAKGTTESSAATPMAVKVDIPKTIFNVHNYTSSEVEKQEATDPDGNRIFNIIIGKTAESIGTRGTMYQSIKNIDKLTPR